MSWWDWDWALVHLLTQVVPNRGYENKRLSDAGVHIKAPKTSDVEHTAWSKNLGMKESDARPWQEVGQMIRQDPDMVNRIQNALNIKRRPYLEGDYLEQLQEIAGQLP